jgi:hypothetical protein
MGNINQEEEVGNKQNQATRTAEVEYIKNGEGDLHAEVECRQLALLLNLSRPLPCIPCITGAGHSRGGPVGAPQRGGQEEEKSIDGMEAVEARRQRPASGGASPTQEAAHVYAGGRVWGRRLVSSEWGRRLVAGHRPPASKDEASVCAFAGAGGGVTARSVGARWGLGHRGEGDKHCFVGLGRIQ